MQRLSAGALVLGITALLAAGLLDPTAPSPPAPSLRSATNTTAGDGSRTLIEARSARDLLIEALGESTGSTLQPEVIFIHVPDPVDSSLDWSYDGMLFALRKAVECADFVADRRWMPWLHDRREIERGFRSGLELDPGLRHDHPGVMLFRQRRPPCPVPEDTERADVPLADCRRGASWLVAFILGEDPLTGVHRTAFEDALRQRDELVSGDSSEAAPEMPLHVVGPAFANSTDSIVGVLEARFDERPAETRRPMRFITGSATGAELDALRRVGTVHTTIHDDLAREQALAQVLKALDLEARKVALLRESTTRRAHAPATGAMRAERFFSEVLEIPFPLSIAGLRNTRDQLALGSWQPPTWRRASVPMPLGSPLRPGSPATPQGFSPLTPPAVDLLLDEIAQVLLHEGIRAVVIEATDVRDTIFLGTELRARIRGLRLFTLRNNLLYLRPERHDALRGMVVVSTYPLMPASRHPPSQHRHLLFPSEESEGVFNATSLVLQRLELEVTNSLEPNSPPVRDPTAARGARFLQSVTYESDDVDPSPPSSRWLTPAPDLWISVVGTRSILPIKTCRTCAGDEPAREVLKRPLGRPEISRAALFGVFMLSFFALAQLGRLGRWQVAADWATRRHGTRRTATDLCAEELTPDQVTERKRTEVVRRYVAAAERVYTLLRWAVILSILLPHSAFIWSFCVADASLELRDILQRPTAALVFLACGVASILVLLKIIFDGVTEARSLRAILRDARKLQPGTHQFREWWSVELHWQLIVFALIGGTYFLMVALYSHAIAHGQLGTVSDLVFFRSVQIDNGVTPLVPLTIIGAILLLWTSWHIRRLERLSKETPFGIALHEHPAGHGDRQSPSARWDDAGSHRYRPTQFLSALAIELRAHLFFGVVPGRKWLHFAWVPPSILWLWFSFGTTVEALVLPPRLELFGLAIPSEVFGVNAFDVLLRSGVLLTQLALCTTLYRFASVAYHLRDLLRRLATTPLLTAFERLPKRISRLARLPLFAQPGSWMVSATSDQGYQFLRRIGAMVREAGATDASSHEDPPSPSESIDWLTLGPLRWLRRSRTATEACRNDRLGENATPDSDEIFLRTAILDAQQSLESSSVDGDPGPNQPIDRRRERFEAKCRRSNQLRTIEGVLHHLWARQPGEPEASSIEHTLREPSDEWSDIASVGSQVQRRFPAGATGLWLRAAEELYALEIVGYLESVLKQLQRMILFLFPTILLTGMLIGSYPFEPQGLMSTFFIALVITTVGVFLWVMVVLNRDEVLNRLSHSDPRRFTWHGTFVLNLVIVIAVGLLALISTEYPAVWHLFLGWFRPLLEAVVN
ncbi:MAG: hypothetical protein AAGC60_19390 [Acidobacteriota bacterium]